jgi:ABC-2 type transport system permease protein
MNLFNKENQILLREMVKTDFKLRYQGSIIGHLWSILKPFMMFTIMYLVFVRFLKFDDGTPHYAVSLLLGMVTWNFFTEATNMGMLSIAARGDLLRKISFPKEIIVISSIIGAAINYGINIAVVLLFAIINGVQLDFGVLMLLPAFVELITFATGLAFILSSFFVKYRDMGPIWELVLQAGMYSTPIIYSITYIIQRGHTGVAKIMMMNPIAQVVQDLRHHIVFDGATISWDIYDNKWMVAVPYLISIVVFIIGFTIFKKNSKKFAEIL